MNDEFPVVDNNEHVIRMLISHIRHCEAEIDRASTGKALSENRLKERLLHDKDGSQTYDFDNYKITVTTGLNHRFDKKKYNEYLQTIGDLINPKFQIVKEVTELQLNKKAIRDLDEYGSAQDKYLKSLFITTSDKKLHISIKDNRKHENNNVVGDVGSTVGMPEQDF